MGKGIIAFVATFAVLFVSIEVFRSMTGREKWETVKTLSYSVAIAVAAFAILALMVAVF